MDTICTGRVAEVMNGGFAIPLYAQSLPSQGIYLHSSKVDVRVYEGGYEVWVMNPFRCQQHFQGLLRRASLTYKTSRLNGRRCVLFYSFMPETTLFLSAEVILNPFFLTVPTVF